MEEVRSSSIRCSVVSLSRVTSARITAWRRSAPLSSPAEGHHVEAHGARLRVGELELARDHVGVRAGVVPHRGPKARDQAPERLAGEGVAREPDQPVGRVIRVLDHAVGR